MSREVRRFDVVFKDPTAVFKPGDVVAGNVTLELTQEVKMKGEIGFFNINICDRNM